MENKIKIKLKFKFDVEMKNLLWPGDGHKDHAHGVDQLAPDVDGLGSKPFHQLIYRSSIISSNHSPFWGISRS